MSPTSRFPRPTTSDITKIGIELPAEASEALDRELEFEQMESREARTHRLSTGVLIGIMALVLFILVTKTSGEAHFAFTDALAGKELGTMSVSGFPVVLVSAIACLLAAGAFFMGRSRHTLTVTAGVVAGNRHHRRVPELGRCWTWLAVPGRRPTSGHLVCGHSAGPRRAVRRHV